jgi:predicted PurR-regulated permease PerM
VVEVSTPGDSPDPTQLPVGDSDPPAVDARGVALTILALAAAILLARYMQSVLIPFVLAALVFYALDPLVDRLQRLRVPRPIGAAFAIALVVGSVAGIGYALMDDALRVVEELPAAAQKVRERWSRNIERVPNALDKMQEAARAIDATADAAAETAPVPRGVTRVRVEAPPFRASSLLVSSSRGMLNLLAQASLVLFLAFFLLLYDDLFKRKLVESIGPTLGRKRVTVQILNDIASQVESFILVQVFTSVVVGVATGVALWALGVNSPWVWGVAAGVLNVVPYFGPMVVAAGLGVASYLQFDSITSALGIAGLSMLISTIEGFILTPALMRRVAEMNRIAIFAGILFWSWLWGVPGMLLAIPMMVVVKVVCDRVEGFQAIGNMLGE